jgi:hypothetical protein
MTTAQNHPEWLTPRVLRVIRRVRRDFEIRAFGEEMARVNRLPLAERRAYINDIIDYAKSKGVSFEKPAEGVTR